jgi:hypothetical protein
MRRRHPYPLTVEEAQRLIRVLTRHDGNRTVRDLYRRHRFWDPCILEQAAAAGIISIEKRRPRTGRPSVVAVLCADGVNKTHAAKLPRRRDLPRGITWREEDFLRYYSCRWGTRFFGNDSAAATYRYVYGRHRALTTGSIRSAGARLARQPWMRAALIYDRRLMNCGGRLQYPDDMRSAAWSWLRLLYDLCRRYVDWPPAVGAVLRHARTFSEATSELDKLPAQ